MTEFKRTLNPSQPVSEVDLLAIISSPHKLKHWNDLNEQALLNAPDKQVIQNIRATASLIVLKEKSIASQNFELMRAMNLFDDTLDAKETVKGMFSSSANTLLQTAKDKLSAPESGDMNLTHSQTRSQALAEIPSKTIAATYAAAQVAWQNPEIVSTTFKRISSIQVDTVKTQLAQSMASENPSYAVGTVLGTSVTQLTISTLDPAKKLHWNQYANALGTGTVPPPLKPYRDFTGRMDIDENPRGDPFIKYMPSKKHYIDSRAIESEVDNAFALEYQIEAKSSKEPHGTGAEMFLSTIKKYHEEGMNISKLYGLWQPGKLGTNHSQFIDAIHNGANLEQAATRTFTGKMASKIGLTHVDTSQLKEASDKNDFSRLLPMFTHPDWGAGEQMNIYSQKFALAHGRPALELVPQRDTEKPKPAMNMSLLSTLNSLPEHQQQVVFEQLKIRLDPLPAVLKNESEIK